MRLFDRNLVRIPALGLYSFSRDLMILNPPGPQPLTLRRRLFINRPVNAVELEIANGAFQIRGCKLSLARGQAQAASVAPVRDFAQLWHSLAEIERDARQPPNLRPVHEGPPTSRIGSTPAPCGCRCLIAASPNKSRRSG